MPQRITLIVSRLDGKYETYFQIVLETRFGKFQLLSENYFRPKENILTSGNYFSRVFLCFQEIDAQSCFLGGHITSCSHLPPSPFLCPTLPPPLPVVTHIRVICPPP